MDGHALPYPAAHHPAVRDWAGPKQAGGGEALRVLCVSHTATSRVAGRLRYGPLLARTDLAVDVVTPDRWHEGGRWLTVDPPHADDVATHILPVRLPRLGPATWQFHHYVGLAATMAQVRPEVIHLWQEPWSLVALQALRLRERLCPGTPIVLEVDQNILKRLPPPFELIRRTVLRHAAFVLARSPDALGVVRACGYAGPSALIDYGVDPDIFRQGDRALAQRRFGLDGFTAGYVGRLVEEKGVDDLIAALALTRGPVRVAILGDGPHRRALLRHAERLGVAERVRILPWGPPEEVARFMGAVDVLALLTRTTRRVREQFGRVIIEAQACGTPVIGSRSGAIPDVVGAGGCIVGERDPVGVAAVLDRLMGDEAEMTRLRAAAVRQVAGRFTYPAIAGTLADAWWTAHRGKVIAAG